MIDPAKTCLFIPAGLKDFKLKLLERVGLRLGAVIKGEVAALERLPTEILPIVGCSPELTALIERWKASSRQFAYWDRGYCRRVFATEAVTSV